MNNFSAFDPLEAKQIANTDVAANAVKREIENILSSYVGWYDPFCELVQNGLDSLEERSLANADGYEPEISIVVDLQQNTLTVSENGTGLDKKKFQQFLAPSFSFKSGRTRGHKGVGATYLAYGFNDIVIHTKTESFQASGRMEGARRWLSDPTPAGNPEMVPFEGECRDANFKKYNSGVSITLKFDPTTHPKKLDWLKANTASVWKTILLVKTGLGAFQPNSEIKIDIAVVSETGDVSTEKFAGIEYFWPHQIFNKSVEYTELKAKSEKLFAKDGPSYRIPSALSKIECVYDRFDTDSLLEHLEFDESDSELMNKYKPVVYFSYVYTAKAWSRFNEDLSIRAKQSVLIPGVQLCANNMPQGEVFQIPLTRNIGRQNQISLVAHFDNCKPDLGRKGFQKSVVDLSMSIGRKLIEELLQKYKKHMRISTGIPPDLKRESKVNQWKLEILDHEKSHPLSLENENFFRPINKISITSEPTREQDVIALFNQLVAGGVIRGISVMSTNEMFVYDGMFKVRFDPPDVNHIFDPTTNPLGVDEELVSEYSGWGSEPKILEYKFNLDGLIENIQDGSKNSNDINLVVVWDIGHDYEGNYAITSLLNKDNLSDRQYHGVTHVMTNLSSNQKEMDLIVLKDLIAFLKDPVAEMERQETEFD